jgi:hypothetical protein
MEGEIYCQWVSCAVEIAKLPKSCRQFFQNGSCLNCKTSDQLGSMTVKDLLQNLKGL